MLILGRRAGESIVLDGGITIVVLACERGGVRLGIQAPSDVTILRGEIVQQVEAENRRAPADPDAARAWLGALGATTASAVVEVANVGANVEANVAAGAADDDDPDPYQHA